MRHAAVDQSKSPPAQALGADDAQAKAAFGSPVSLHTAAEPATEEDIDGGLTQPLCGGEHLLHGKDSNPEQHAAALAPPSPELQGCSSFSSAFTFALPRSAQSLPLPTWQQKPPLGAEPKAGDGSSEASGFSNEHRPLSAASEQPAVLQIGMPAAAQLASAEDAAVRYSNTPFEVRCLMRSAA